jgi:hypothetical protein
METQNNNIDNFLESGIKDSLNMEIRSRFTESVMDKIQLQERYKREEAKTGKFVKRISFAVISVIGLASVIITAVLSGAGSSDSVDNTIAESYNSGIFNLFQKIYDFLGNGNPLLSILSLMGFVIIVAGYFLIDRKIFRNG